MIEHGKALPRTSQPWLPEFGQRLELLRGRTGLTQAELAGPGLSESFVSLLETARSSPSVDTVFLLARRLQTSLGELLLNTSERRLDAALALLALARDAAQAQPALTDRLVQAAEELVPDMPQSAKAEAAIIRGMAATTRGNLPKAQQYGKVALDLAGRAHAGHCQARALTVLGRVALLRRNFSQSFEFLSRAVALYRKTGSLRSEAGITALIWWATASFLVNRPRHARRLYQHALKLSSRLRLSLLRGQALLGLGYLEWAEGDLAEATRTTREAADEFSRAESLIDLSRALSNLGLLLREHGDLPNALVALQQSIRLKTRLGDIRGRSTVYEELARLRIQLGHLQSARKAAEKALEDAKKMADRQHRARAIATLGRVEAACGHRDLAIRYLREGARGLKALGVTDEWTEAARDLDLLRGKQRGQKEASHYLNQALKTHPSRSRAK